MAYVLDVETYVDYFLVLFKEIGGDDVRAFELHSDATLDKPALSNIMRSNLTVGFNSNNYDLYMIAAALSGYDNRRLKKLSDTIITSQAPAWKVAQENDLDLPTSAYGRPLWNHIDIISVAPGQASLKLYGGRLNAPKLQDLPFEPNSNIAPEDREPTREYCLNDLETTELLYTTLSSQMSLRQDMSKRYRIDLRSKSDAQIAEAVFRSEIGRITGKKVYPPKVNPKTTYRYKDPKIIEFESAQLNSILDRILDTRFGLAPTGSIMLPDWLKESKIKIGGSEYQMGIGGLHSCESARSIKCADDYILRDADVASYYPSIILQQGLIPQTLGKSFIDVYQSIVDERLAAKRSGDKVTANSLKITINGSFGKLGSKYSALYAPDLLIQTTLTGQLALLMLIERLEQVGISVVSANTDGIVSYYDKGLDTLYHEICWEWMLDTSYELEFTDYSGLYSRDVNSYVAVKPDGSIKGKGAFADPNLMKNPQFQIVGDAVKAYLGKGTPVEETVNACDDVSKFVMVRNVTGGATWRGEYVGKTVRFYYSNDMAGSAEMVYQKSGNKVPQSDGCKPLMLMTGDMPKDIDREVYIKMAKDAIRGVGYECS